MARLSEFHNWLHDVRERQDGISEDRVDITTGVTTRFPGVVDGHRAGYEGVRPATQVGPRTVEGCLGSHNEGVSGVDEGVESAPLLLSKRGRSATSD